VISLSFVLVDLKWGGETRFETGRLRNLENFWFLKSEPFKLFSLLGMKKSLSWGGVSPVLYGNPCKSPCTIQNLLGLSLRRLELSQ
jgi:hypothetical protein